MVVDLQQERNEIKAERDANFRRFDTLRNGIEEEIDHLRSKGKRNAAIIHFENADRLQEILDAAEAI